MNLNLIKFISKRFSQSGKRQRFLNFARLVAFISVMLGSMALILSLSTLDGFDSMLRENAVKFTSHITVRAFDNQPLPDYKSVLKKMKREIREIQKIAPVIQRKGLIRSKSFIEGVIIKGMKTEYDITGLRKNMIEGKFTFSSNRSKQLIIGKRLARKLDIGVGGELVVYAIKQQASDEIPFPDIDKFEVIGIYETGMAKYDDIYVYIPFEIAAEFFKMPESTVSSYDIILYDVYKAPEISKEIESIFGYPYYCFTVFELHNAMFAWIKLQKKPIPIVLGLISIVAVLNIITILLITVVEKTHSIGVLRALGLNRRGILSVFIFQGVSIGLAGTLSGSAIGLLICWLQQTFKIITLKGEIYFLDAIPIQINLWHYELVIGVSVLLSFLATLIPAYIATKVTPIKALRFK